jgi:tetratricopeptide (TPR) repeat protein
MRALTLAATALTVLASGAVAQDLAGNIAAGDAARCQRNATQALTHYRAALALDSTSYDANWKTSRVLVDLGLGLPNAQRARRDSLYAEARALAERAVRVNAGGADGHYMVAVAVGRVALTMGARQRVRFARVIRDEALRATELNPRHDGALHVLGRWNAEIQRLPGVTKFFAKTFLGASIFNEATWENAEQYLTRAVNIDGQNIYHHLDLAETLIDMDRPADARTHLQTVAQLPLGCDPQDPAYKQQAAALLQRISRP